MRTATLALKPRLLIGRSTFGRSGRRTSRKRKRNSHPSKTRRFPEYSLPENEKGGRNDRLFQSRVKTSSEGFLVMLNYACPRSVGCDRLRQKISIGTYRCGNRIRIFHHLAGGRHFSG